MPIISYKCQCGAPLSVKDEVKPDAYKCQYCLTENQVTRKKSSGSVYNIGNISGSQVVIGSNNVVQNSVVNVNGASDSRIAISGDNTQSSILSRLFSMLSGGQTVVKDNGRKSNRGVGSLITITGSTGGNFTGKNIKTKGSTLGNLTNCNVQATGCTIRSLNNSTLTGNGNTIDVVSSDSEVSGVGNSVSKWL